MPKNSVQYNGDSIESKNARQWNGNTHDLRLIGHGTAGLVFELDNKTVAKVYLGTGTQGIEDMESEKQAYRKLKPVENSCKHVLRSYDLDNPHGLVLERCLTTVRRWIRHRRYEPQSEALRLALEAAKGLFCIHNCGIRQGDVGCHNMLLDSHGTLKIADFSGSLVVGYNNTATVDYEVRSKHPSETEPSKRAEIFALGSAIYEMMTCRAPYKGRSYAEVQQLFKQDRFPEDFPTDFKNSSELRSVAERCWGKGGVYFKSAGQVLDALDRLGPSPPCSLAYFEIFSKRKVPKTPAASSVQWLPTLSHPCLKEERRGRKATRSSKTSSKTRRPKEMESYVKNRPAEHRGCREVTESSPKWTIHRHDRSGRHINSLVHSFQKLFFGHGRVPSGRRE